MHWFRANFVLLLAFIGFLSSPLYAQVNLKTGYNFSVLSTPGLDRLVSSFNQSQSYSSSFSNLQWLHGFEAGLRFKRRVHALELTYQGAYQSFKATGQSVDGTAYTDKLKYAVQSAAIGYQIGERLFGLGTDLQYQWYRVKFESGQTSAKMIDVQHMMGLKFYLIFTLKGDNTVDMSIQPYMVLPFQYYNLDPLSKIFGVEATSGQDKWIRYGLTVSFYNGAK